MCMNSIVYIRGVKQPTVGAWVTAPPGYRLMATRSWWGLEEGREAGGASMRRTGLLHNLGPLGPGGHCHQWQECEQGLTALVTLRLLQSLPAA